MAGRPPQEIHNANLFEVSYSGFWARDKTSKENKEKVAQTEAGQAKLPVHFRQGLGSHVAMCRFSFRATRAVVGNVWAARAIERWN